MKICFLGPANSAHIRKWCKWFSEKGHEVHVISFEPGSIENTFVHLVKVNAGTNDNDLKKIRYLFTGKQIKALINKIEPDVINAHYASSYGAALALSGIRHYYLSVWGSDIYDFPQKSPLHEIILRYSLKRADTLLSTSWAMAKEASKYTDKHFEITPFGVDIELFNPDKRSRDDNYFVIGTVKGLSNKYGIQYLLEAAAIIKKTTSIPLKVRIAGSGPQEEEYHILANSLHIDDITTWLGFISQEEAAIEWANMDVAVIPSEAESFGVSAIEAQASGTPVIISDIPGLIEATDNGKGGIIVPRNNSKAIADAVIYYYNHPDERLKKGRIARQVVCDLYEMEKCFDRILEIYSS